MTEEEAIEKVIEVLAREVGPDLVDPDLGQLAIDIDYVDEHEFGWIVPFNSVAYMRTGDPNVAYLPNVFVVPNDGGEPFMPPTYLPTREYLDKLQNGEFGNSSKSPASAENG